VHVWWCFGRNGRRVFGENSVQEIHKKRILFFSLFYLVMRKPWWKKSRKRHCLYHNHTIKYTNALLRPPRSGIYLLPAYEGLIASWSRLKKVSIIQSQVSCYHNVFYTTLLALPTYKHWSCTQQKMSRGCDHVTTVAFGICRLVVGNRGRGFNFFLLFHFFARIRRIAFFFFRFRLDVVSSAAIFVSRRSSVFLDFVTPSVNFVRRHYDDFEYDVFTGLFFLRHLSSVWMEGEGWVCAERREAHLFSK